MEKIDKDTREYLRIQLKAIENELLKSEKVGYIDINYITEKIKKIKRELKFLPLENK